MNKFILLVVFVISGHFLFAGNLCYLKGDPGFRVLFSEESLADLKANQEVLISFHSKTLMLCGYYGISNAIVKSFSEEQVDLIKEFFKKNEGKKHPYSLCLYLFRKDFKSVLGEVEKRNLEMSGGVFSKNVLIVADDFEIVGGYEPSVDEKGERANYVIVKNSKWVALEHLPNSRNEKNALVEKYYINEQVEKKPDLSVIDAYRIIIESEGKNNWRTISHQIKMMAAELKAKPDATLQQEHDELLLVYKNLKVKPKGKPVAEENE